MAAIERSIKNFPTHQHNNFIVLDFACENVEQFLKRVKIILSVEIAFSKRFAQS